MPVRFCRRALVPGILALLWSSGALAQAGGDDLLKKVDQQANNFKDATFHFKMRIKEANDQAREIEFVSKQKGTQKRIVRFLSPGDIKGMGMLIENADTMYALLPAFNNRVRRMGTHAKNQSFFGSDLAGEDMSAIEFNQTYAAKAGGAEGEQTILELQVKPGKEAEFPRLKMWVDPKLSVATKIEYYDSAGKKLRTQLRQDFKKDEGADHHSPYKLVFIDHRRNNHVTELLLQSVKVNQGLADDEFSVRALQRN